MEGVLFTILEDTKYALGIKRDLSRAEECTFRQQSVDQYHMH